MALLKLEIQHRGIELKERSQRMQYRKVAGRAKGANECGILRKHPAAQKHFNASKTFAELSDRLVAMKAANHRKKWSEALFLGYELVVEASKAILQAKGLERDPRLALVRQFENDCLDTSIWEVERYRFLFLEEVVETSEDTVSEYVEEVCCFYRTVVENWKP